MFSKEFCDAWDDLCQREKQIAHVTFTAHSPIMGSNKFTFPVSLKMTVGSFVQWYFDDPPGSYDVRTLTARRNSREDTDWGEIIEEGDVLAVCPTKVNGSGGCYCRGGCGVVVETPATICEACRVGDT